jgi:hypothetical protein
MESILGTVDMFRNTLFNEVDSIHTCISAFVNDTTLQINRYNDELINNSNEKMMLEMTISTHKHIIFDQDIKIAAQDMEIVHLKTTIASLNEENSTFKRVSSIIQYDKENARLRNEISILEKKLDKFGKHINAASTYSSDVNKQVTSTTTTIYCDAHKSVDVACKVTKEVSQTAPKSLEIQDKTVDDRLLPLKNSLDPDPDGENVDMYEQKISKIVYYVTCDDSKRIFEKNEDGNVGDELGYLYMVNGKLRPNWNLTRT